ncbi:MAG: bifunctional folylpolyglutamate synthase/dihydrofolate synthase [Euryarchaeota archaeon]|nr:bifunctional folylpolyglutamate synthase/dihydrofolate synthase [Euryarchaeota archaeon]
MKFEESLNWLYGFEKFGIKLGLERISHIAEKLGNPQNNYKIIHVAGTNGKGSVCKFLASILTSGGYKIGIYLSPHLQRFSERIVVDNKEISEDEFVSLVDKIKPIVDEMIKNDNTPTFFEIVTAIAFQYFSDKSVDFAVIEVGLGGKYDATNIVNPMVSVITNISLEHTDILGKTIKDIALQKAGIVKDDIAVVTAANGDALKVIKNVAKERNATVYVIDEKRWKRTYCDTEGQEFSIKGDLTDYSVKTSMLGKHQGENIALAIASIENIQMNGVYIPETSIIDGVAKATNPGRLEIVKHEPIILLDGAHNPDGMRTLRATLDEDLDYDKLILVLGILSDKDITSMLSIIVPDADIIVVTKSKNNRACEPSKLKEMIEKLGYKKKVVVKDLIPDAVKYAESIAKKKDLICITGSLFTVGEAREYIVK